MLLKCNIQDLNIMHKMYSTAIVSMLHSNKDNKDNEVLYRLKVLSCLAEYLQNVHLKDILKQNLNINAQMVRCSTSKFPERVNAPAEKIITGAIYLDILRIIIFSTAQIIFNLKITMPEFYNQHINLIESMCAIMQHIINILNAYNDTGTKEEMFSIMKHAINYVNDTKIPTYVEVAKTMDTELQKALETTNVEGVWDAVAKYKYIFTTIERLFMLIWNKHHVLYTDFLKEEIMSSSDKNIIENKINDVSVNKPIEIILTEEPVNDRLNAKSNDKTTIEITPAAA